MKYRFSKDIASWGIFIIILAPAIIALVLMQIYEAKDLEDTIIIIVGGGVIIAACTLLLPVIKGD